jgi:hypothetical protein
MAGPEPLFGTSHFRVLIGRGEIGFSEVSRLTSETDAPDVVVLRRALTQATELYEWRRRVAGGEDDRRDVTIEMLDAAGGAVVNSWRLVGARPHRWSGPSFDAGGEDDRRDVTIEMLDAAGGAVVNSWRLVGARPHRWSGPSFDAGGVAVAMEELELTYDDLVWLAAPDTIPTKERR